jgi:ADP-heptose:LPS heptosyltransferase
VTWCDPTPPGGPLLVLRALGLGDVLTVLPALRGLRRLNPGRPLVLAGPAATGQWLSTLGVVDAVVPTEGLDGPPPGRGLGPHAAVNLHGRGPQSHELLLAGAPEHLLAFAGPGAPTGPRWEDDEHEVVRWCRLVRWAGGECGREGLRLTPPRQRPTDPGPVRVVLHPGAASSARRWPAPRWALLARCLGAQRVAVQLTGNAAEAPVCARISAVAGLPPAACTAGLLDLPGLAERIAGADLLVCGDTGVAHLATALGTRSVLLFGPTPPDRWGPLLDADRHTVLWHGDGPGDPHAAVADPTLLRIGVGEVLDAVQAQLERARRRQAPMVI